MGMLFFYQLHNSILQLLNNYEMSTIEQEYINICFTYR